MIEVSHLTKYYGSFLAVDDLSFTIPDGHVYGFLGPNGAGKSTTMNIMTGCLSPTAGKVSIDGHDILAEPEAAKRCMGYLPEQPVLKGLLGICFSSELNAKQFPYGIGVEYDGREVDKDFEILTIPASTYAVFMSRGKMPDAFVETYHRIVTEFFPQSAQYEYAENTEIEVYPSANTADPNYACEIWIAVKEKE